MTKNYQSYRLRAFQVFFKGAKNDQVNPLDYQFDDLIRNALGLPKRPDKALPYVGWLGAIQSGNKTDQLLSQKGLNFIKSWEGCVLGAYRCSAGVLTIGYGHTKTTKANQVITFNEAERLLKLDVQDSVGAVNRLVKVRLSQNQFDALVSFTFNVGIGAFERSTLLKKLNNGDIRGAASEFLRWTRAAGKEVLGLVNRRESERRLFLLEDDYQ
jgi:lysozyme